MTKIAIKTIGFSEKTLFARFTAILILITVAVYYFLLASTISAQAGTPVLTGSTWQWEYFADGIKAMEILDANYTITFAEDGTFRAKADCNIVLGKYTAAEGAISIQPGPTTLAACPSGSLEREFIDYLNRATIYSHTEDGKLLLELPADSGSLRFRAQPQISGTVTYLERIALPENATIRVQLLDVSMADTQAPVIGETSLTAAGRQVPFAFSLAYPEDAVQENHAYGLSARITDPEGKLLFITDTHIPVLSAGTPEKDIEIILRKNP